MGRRASDFARRGAIFKEQPRVLVLCEDSKSSVSYLEDAARHFRSYAIVRIAHCGRTDPLGIVQEAVRQIKNFERVYCVVDRDSHVSFDAALRLAQQYPEKINFIPSYPAYEFWLLLHHKFSRKPYSPHGGRSAAENLLGDLCSIPAMVAYKKGVTQGLFYSLLGALEVAKANARKVRAAAEVEQDPNPSSDIDLLLAALSDLGMPESL
jgi:hypothetical protein